jgi:hypothetical protein
MRTHEQERAKEVSVLTALHCHELPFQGQDLGHHTSGRLWTYYTPIWERKNKKVTEDKTRKTGG